MSWYRLLSAAIVAVTVAAPLQASANPEWGLKKALEKLPPQATPDELAKIAATLRPLVIEVKQELIKGVLAKEAPRLGDRTGWASENLALALEARERYLLLQRGTPTPTRPWEDVEPEVRKQVEQIVPALIKQLTRRRLPLALFDRRRRARIKARLTKQVVAAVASRLARGDRRDIGLPAVSRLRYLPADSTTREEIVEELVRDYTGELFPKVYLRVSHRGAILSVGDKSTSVAQFPKDLADELRRQHESDQLSPPEKNALVYHFLIDHWHRKVRAELEALKQLDRVPGEPLDRSMTRKVARWCSRYRDLSEGVFGAFGDLNRGRAKTGSPNPDEVRAKEVLSKKFDRLVSDVQRLGQGLELLWKSWGKHVVEYERGPAHRQNLRELDAFLKLLEEAKPKITGHWALDRPRLEWGIAKRFRRIGRPWGSKTLSGESTFLRELKTVGIAPAGEGVQAERPDADGLSWTYREARWRQDRGGPKRVEQDRTLKLAVAKLPRTLVPGGQYVLKLGLLIREPGPKSTQAYRAQVSGSIELLGRGFRGDILVSAGTPTAKKDLTFQCTSRVPVTPHDRRPLSIHIQSPGKVPFSVMCTYRWVEGPPR